MSRKLKKTSVQLDPDDLLEMETWPGLSRSEAIRLSVQRANYLATLSSERIASLADAYERILGAALQGFGYGDYRTVARALPAIVEGFVRENPSVPWKGIGGQELDPTELAVQLSQLDALGRIGILDCIVANRYRKQDSGAGKNARNENVKRERNVTLRAGQKIKEKDISPASGNRAEAYSASLVPLTPKELLSRSGKTMTELANMTGLTISYMSLIFAGKRTPSLKTTGRIATAMGRDFEEVAQVLSQ